MSAAHRIVAIANDAVPGMGLPVSASGMRTAGLAAGLRAHGFDVTVTVPRHRVEHLEAGHAAFAAVPPGTMVLRYGALRQFLDTARPFATLICNSNYIDEIEGAATGHIVFDFFAPKVLEAEGEGHGPAHLDALRARKRRALDMASAVIVNGAKKLDYARDWIAQADPARPEIPVVEADMTYPWPARETEPAPGALSVVVAGYYQRWLDYGNMFVELAGALEAIPALRLTLLIPRLDVEITQAIPGLAACLAHPRTEVRRIMLLDDYFRLLQRHDLFVDLFQPTEERRLAMVTRSVVALGMGVPIVHPGFTEVSGIVEESGAGWLLDPADPTALHDLLHRLAARPEELVARRDAARALGLGRLAPADCLRATAEMLGGMM
ncbi:glycosyltransferase involved in cell wall biosynthesis [Palleronia aestuarii]|uniref:Glycosyltransferase involved in cell wall biosynthesis n=1 Tax=Palleronia aestuarii TaxID=568105 RepID=A0A2W7N3S8_9RHOB|nr:hypothetical protein [Palleronia aestuarii]PZX14343.1 glycosyltransferase involved in cell wall biosynthesis [Palleronia aestuarii]